MPGVQRLDTREVRLAARRIAAVVVNALLAAMLLSACGRKGPWVEGGGIVEMDEIDVSSLEGGRVVRLTVDEGDSVRAGDTVAVLQHGELAAQVQAQIATTARAVAESRDVSSGPRAGEIRGARADLSAAEARLTLAERQLARALELQKSQAIADAVVDSAHAGRDAAKAARDSARERLRLLEAGSRPEEITAAQSAAMEARAQLAAAQSRLGELMLTATSGGVVLLRNYDPGEVALPGSPIVTLGDPTRMWVRVYIAAPLIDRVRVGAHAEIFTQGSSKPFSGHVASVATQAEFTPRVALTEEERANIVFAVRVRVDPTAGALKAGLPVKVRIAAPASPPVPQ